MKRNTYKLLSKIIMVLLVVTVLVTFFYGVNVYSKQNGDVPNNNDVKIPSKNAFTKIIKTSEICEENKECNEDISIKISNNKMALINLKITYIDGIQSSILTINDQKLNIPESSKIFEVGFLNSKYFVVSYKDASRIFYYLDEQLRDVKRVENVEESANIDFLTYNYFACKQSEESIFGTIKNNYRMNIDENGTFVSSIIDSVDERCSY